MHRTKCARFTPGEERSTQPAIHPQLAYQGRKPQLARRGRRPLLIDSGGHLAAQPPTDPEQPSDTRPMVVEDHRSREGVNSFPRPLLARPSQHQHDSAAYIFPVMPWNNPASPMNLQRETTSHQLPTNTTQKLAQPSMTTLYNPIEPVRHKAIARKSCDNSTPTTQQLSTREGIIPVTNLAYSATAQGMPPSNPCSCTKIVAARINAALD
ncbi:hypothetical protein EDB84DRAFT_1567166 [Lactarius hengduanensis]|nr:hypothetical protein EDB84DRAFT_1567166 [Lactarius hengduanensis]